MQFNDILKLVVAAHEECKHNQEDEHLCNRDEWLNEVDERVDQCSKFSAKIKSYSSRSSRRSSKSKSSA